MRSTLYSLSLVTLLCLATTACRPTQPQEAPTCRSARELPPRTLAETKRLLEPAVGGTWEVKKGRLVGRKKGKSDQWVLVCVVIPNPRTSDAGLRVAQEIGFFYSAVYYVRAYDETHLVIGMSKSLAREDKRIASLLGMNVVDPPSDFHQFVAERCGCVWDRKALTLKRRTPEARAPADADKPRR
jgi:hypothetical protein